MTVDEIKTLEHVGVETVEGRFLLVTAEAGYQLRVTRPSSAEDEYKEGDTVTDSIHLPLTATETPLTIEAVEQADAGIALAMLDDDAVASDTDTRIAELEQRIATLEAALEGKEAAQ